MKSAVYHKYGPPDGLKIEHLDKPEPGPDQVLVAVKSSAINPVDWKIRKGKLRFVSGFSFPKQLGSDFSGVIEQSNLSGFKPGDHVFGMINPVKGGSHGEYIVAGQDQVALKPRNVSFNEAAAIPLAGLTALQTLKYKGGIKPGHNVLINACTGGVGHFAVQYAKAKKASVTGICSTGKVAFARELGADHVIDYKKENIYQHDVKYDIILDPIGNLRYSDIKNFMNSNAVMIAFSPGPSELLQLPLNLFSSRKVKLYLTSPKNKDLEELKELTEQEKIRPRIAAIYQLDQVIQAYRKIEEGHVAGKVVVQVADD